MKKEIIKAVFLMILCMMFVGCEKEKSMIRMVDKECSPHYTIFRRENKNSDKYTYSDEYCQMLVDMFNGKTIVKGDVLNMEDVYTGLEHHGDKASVRQIFAGVYHATQDYKANIDDPMVSEQEEAEIEVSFTEDILYINCTGYKYHEKGSPVLQY